MVSSTDTLSNYLLKLQFLYYFLCARYYPTGIYGRPRPFPKPLPQSGRSIIILKHYTCILLLLCIALHRSLAPPTSRRAAPWYGTFRLNFHRFDRF